jgi:hypothetical protein
MVTGQWAREFIYWLELVGEISSPAFENYQIFLNMEVAQ